MSIHAQLSPEAQAKLRVQKWLSTVSSVFISLLVVALVGLALALILLPSLFEESPTIVTYSSPSEKKEEPAKQKVGASTWIEDSVSASGRVPDPRFLLPCLRA